MQWGLWPSHNGKITHRVPSVLQCRFQWMCSYGRFWQQVLDNHRAGCPAALCYGSLLISPLSVHEQDRCMSVIDLCSTATLSDRVHICVDSPLQQWATWTGRRCLVKWWEWRCPSTRLWLYPGRAWMTSCSLKVQHGGNWPPVVHHLHCTASLLLESQSFPWDEVATQKFIP